MRTPLVLRVLAFTDAPAAPTATAHRPEAYATHQLTTEDWARLADRNPANRDDVLEHAV